MTTIPYAHSMYAHCESGTVAGLLRHHGMQISEPLVFGIAAGICAVFITTPKVPFPVFEMRTKPGDIRKRIAGRLGVIFTTYRFKDPRKACDRLAAILDKEIPVALQVDMFYMEYIPDYMKTHFNAHYIVAVGREAEGFIVSDCYYPTLSRLSEAALERGRFARGDFAPSGFMYHAASVPAIDTTRLKTAIIQGIRQASFTMIKLPIPFIGIKAIRKFARSIPTWPKKTRSYDELSHWIMMIHVLLEERGTGGGGFRFMYATFLQEASRIFGSAELLALSKRMMENGDKWRELSMAAARSGKNRDLGPERLGEIRDLVLARADEEERLFSILYKLFR
ncbi:MAG: BtrH N-terminal domain-containing protein [Chitinispirillaceae bacterium]|nr:BtrH N-terminal domain-containing protein [Chitinispirillaceae bacterium]